MNETFFKSLPIKIYEKSKFAPFHARLWSNLLGSSWYEQLFPFKAKGNKHDQKQVEKNIEIWLTNLKFIEPALKKEIMWQRLAQCAYEHDLIDLFNKILSKMDSDSEKFCRIVY